MAVAYQQGSGLSVPGGGYMEFLSSGGSMASLESTFFLPVFSLAFSHTLESHKNTKLDP